MFLRDAEFRRGHCDDLRSRARTASELREALFSLHFAKCLLWLRSDNGGAGTSHTQSFHPSLTQHTYTLPTSIALLPGFLAKDLFGKICKALSWST